MCAVEGQREAIPSLGGLPAPGTGAPDTEMPSDDPAAGRCPGYTSKSPSEQRGTPEIPVTRFLPSPSVTFWEGRDSGGGFLGPRSTDAFSLTVRLLHRSQSPEDREG